MSDTKQPTHSNLIEAPPPGLEYEKWYEEMKQSGKLDELAQRGIVFSPGGTQPFNHPV